jgi:hypothetical protein
MGTRSRVRIVSWKGHCVVAVALMLVAGVITGSQTGATRVVSVDDPRPLAKAVALIEERYGWVITYEDPRYEYEGDIDDVTAVIRRDFDLSKKVLIPRGGRFDYYYELAGEAEQPRDPVTFLEKLIETYNASGLPGQFELAQTGNIFHVLPVAVTNRDGQDASQSSILETPISLPAGEWMGHEVLGLVLRAVSEASGVKVEAGTVPFNLLRSAMEGKIVRDIPARVVLARALAASGRKLSWHLFYGPGTRMYFLNVHVVQ